MFFRGRQPETSIWRRFRSGTDSFTFIKESDYYAAHIVANAERVVDLFHALSDQLPPAVDLAIADSRANANWAGEQLALPDVRDAIARLKVPLAGSGGVELSVYTPEDQLTLNEHLELFIYSRTDRWLYVLQGKGLQEARMVATRSWKVAGHKFQPAPALEEALAAAIERLGLHRT
jgi:hypothetical protein